MYLFIIKLSIYKTKTENFIEQFKTVVLFKEKHMQRIKNSKISCKNHK